MSTPPLTQKTAADLASLFETLSDPTRVRIIAVLVEGETGFGELVERIGLSDSAVSHQLRRLLDKHLIRSRKQGRKVFVSIEDEHVVELFQRSLDHILHGDDFIREIKEFEHVS